MGGRVEYVRLPELFVFFFFVHTRVERKVRWWWVSKADGWVGVCA